MMTGDEDFKNGFVVGITVGAIAGLILGHALFSPSSDDEQKLEERVNRLELFDYSAHGALQTLSERVRKLEESETTTQCTCVCVAETEVGK